MKVSIWKVVLGLVLIALLIGAGGAIYRAGYARGTMSEMSFEDMPFAHDGFEEMMPYGGTYGMPGMSGMRSYGGYSHFSFGRMLFGGFIFLLVVGGIFRFGMMRRGCMHPRMYRDGKGGPPWMRYGDCGGEETDDVEDAEDESEE